MAQRSWGLLLGLLLVAAVHVRAADEVPAGNYKVTVLAPGDQSTLWLVKLDSKDGKWSGEVIGKREDFPDTEISDVRAADGTLRFTLTVTGGRKFTFEGKLPPDGKKINGSLDVGRLFPAELELTTLKSLDSFDVAKDTLAKPGASATEVVDAALTLLRQAGDKKAKADEVRSWATKAVKASEAYGHRYHLDTSAKVAGTLARQDEYPAEAVQFAKQASRLLGPGDKRAVQRTVLEALSAALKKDKKDDEAKEVDAKLEKLSSLAPAKYAGRKGKSDRVVVVELFTGAECPPCVAADYAFDALPKTYSPKEVALLEYHVHIPGPDPLTNADTMDRLEYYGVRSAPTILFNGKTGAGGGGGKKEAPDKYDEYVDAINPLLETPAGAEIKLTAAQKGPKIEITGTASKLPEKADKLRLRFVLVEDEVKYKGGNKVDSFTSVVRDMPGGAKGFDLKKETKHTATVDVEELRKKLKKYLETFEKDEAPFPNKDRPLELKKLRVIALVQNDETKEILQAAQVDVKEEKAE